MKRINWAIVAIIIIALGILVSLLVARQKAQARFIEAAREADSLSFVAMALQEQVKAMVGLGEYGVDTVWAPPEIDTLKLQLPPDTILVPTYAKTVSFDTTKNFEYGDWAFGVRAKGRFFCDEEYKHLNKLELYPTYWIRPPPLEPDILQIDPQLLSRIGFGAVVVNDYLGVSGRYNRFTLMALKRLGSGWAAGGVYEFWNF